MSGQDRELTTKELEVVIGGSALNFAALNPQPIPPGRVDFGGYFAQPISGYLRTPGCPGPL